MSNSAADHLDDWLLSEAAEPWLQQATTSELPIHQLATRFRASLTQEQAHRVLELVELRERARNKFPAAERMFFTRTALEQSTDYWIARYKAQRFADFSWLADLCCGMGGDTVGLARVAEQLLLCDRSTELSKFAARNVREAASDSKSEISVVTDDVSSINLANMDAWHIDPDRRSQGARSTQTQWHEPSDTTIDTLLSKNATAAIKLAPACECPARWADESELEWISRGGECRQLVVWHGELTCKPGERRATLLRDIDAEVQVVRSVAGDGTLVPPADESIDRYLYEPDAAVLAGGLSGQLAELHGWWCFAATGGYMTGPMLVDELSCQRFEVQDVVPLNVKKLARHLREQGIGHLEIKHRAVNISPERLHQQLKLVGDNRATLLLTRQGEKQIAIVARRIEHETNESYQ